MSKIDRVSDDHVSNDHVSALMGRLASSDNLMDIEDISGTLERVKQRLTDLKELQSMLNKKIESMKAIAEICEIMIKHC